VEGRRGGGLSSTIRTTARARDVDGSLSRDGTSTETCRIFLYEFLSSTFPPSPYHDHLLIIEHSELMDRLSKMNLSL
jgi:hypothetical protein